MSLLGIDMGTTGCKSSLFDAAGRLLCSAYEEYDLLRPEPGWAELDAQAVWEKVKRTIRAAVAGAPRDPVRAIATSSMGEAVVPVTRDRRILGPSILNFDVRGAEFLPELRTTLSDAALYARNGNTLANQFGLTKLKWIKTHRPQLYEQTDLFLLWGSFVAFMLGGDAVTDYALANRTLLFDLDRQDWSDELLRWAGLDREKLAPTSGSGLAIGRVTPAVAQELGLPAQVLIVTGTHDQCANAVGCGVLTPGRAMYGMGTYICMAPPFEQRPAADMMIARGLNTEHHAAPGRFISFIYNHGGSLLKWYRDTFAVAERQAAQHDGRDIYAELIAEMPAGPSSVLALPHFAPTGPPEFIEDSTGVLVGLKLETARGDILKGLLESVTFYLRECLESLAGTGIVVNELVAAGGGSKSDAWLQLSADILNTPLTRARVTEAGGLGAAIIAGVGAGTFPSFEAGVAAMVGLERRFEPHPRMTAAYQPRYEKYQALWPLLQGYLRSL